MNKKELFNFIFIIDATSPITVVSLHDAIEFDFQRTQKIFRQVMENRGINCVGVNAKFIFFKDYGIDAEPMVESRFFKLPDEIENLQNLTKRINYWGGGDIPDNSLEALYFALISKFPKAEQDVVVHNKVVLFTASEAKPFYHVFGVSHPEEFGSANRVPLSKEAVESTIREVIDGNIFYKDFIDGYPCIFPPTIDEFHNFYDSLSDLEQLYILAPDESPWDDMKNWSKVKYRKQTPGVMNDDDFDADFVFDFII